MLQKKSNQPTSQSTSQTTSQIGNRPTNWPTKQTINQPTNQPTSQEAINQTANPPANRPANHPSIPKRSPRSQVRGVILIRAQCRAGSTRQDLAQLLTKMLFHKKLSSSSSSSSGVTEGSCAWKWRATVGVSVFSTGASGRGEGREYFWFCLRNVKAETEVYAHHTGISVWSSQRTPPTTITICLQ